MLIYKHPHDTWEDLEPWAQRFSIPDQADDGERAAVNHDRVQRGTFLVVLDGGGNTIDATSVESP